MFYVKRKIFNQRRVYTMTKELASIDEALAYADKYTRVTATIYRIETSVFDGEKLVYTLDTGGREKDFRQEVKLVHADELLPTGTMQEKEPPKSAVQKTELPEKEAKSLPDKMNNIQEVRDKTSPTKLFTIKHGITYFDSRQVAVMVDKRHDNLVRDIDGYYKTISENINSHSSKLRADDYFKKSSYKAGTGKTYPCYLISKMGCEFIGNKMTGDKGILFTAMYVKLFNEMETIQKQKKTEYWQYLRARSKEEYKALTDMIKIFVKYATAQGSKNARYYYIIFSKLINGITATIDRDNTDMEHLHSIITTMTAIRKAITDGMAKCEPYKQIYSTCKNRLKSLKDWGALALAS
ncbi:Rha family transcriptional regulator [Megamonas hypermegale]|uniref:Rha family transcriptional regulator n=1 Tax=Megamonas hypermegale TaxID=158847 RepID=UPI0026EEDE2D|nr:Rha family transcriptional regulator [Megamonas hypermegale]